jgi:hypothetical protein
MDYKQKYLKYKQKYLNLKNFIGGRPNESYVSGINYEGGKIIEHIKKFSNCVAYANCQIAMDAPYHDSPRIADESVRSTGRSESQFHGYDENKLKDKLLEIFSVIRSKYPGVKIIIQIARGRSAEPTFHEVIKPVLDRLGITNFETKYGYRSTDYYVPTDKEPFVFVNYGMFAELSSNIKVEVGEICNPVVTYDITKYNATADPESSFTIENRQSFEGDGNNILNHLDFKKLTLFGIADDMKFITPVDYKKEHIMWLVEHL